MFEALLIGAGLIVLFLLLRIESHAAHAANGIEKSVELLRSIDSELFHVARIQKPDYGQCFQCQRRAYLSDGPVDPKDAFGRRPKLCGVCLLAPVVAAARLETEDLEEDD